MSRRCGGCALIESPLAEQLRQKAELVRSAIHSRPELAATKVSSCLAAPVAFAYRNRAKLAVTRRDGETLIGLYGRGSNAIVDHAPCLVTGSALRRGMDELRRWLTAHRLAPPDGPVFYVDLRECAGGGWHLTLVVAREQEDVAALPLDELVGSCPELVGVAVNFGDPSSSYPMGPLTRTLRGGDTFDVAIPDEARREVTLSVPVGGFFQVATSLLPTIHARMRVHLAGDGPLYDLYCGVGVHGLMIEKERAPAPTDVVGIEESAAAVAAAEVNAQRLGVSARYLSGRVEELLARELDDHGGHRFVVNPARAGCRPAVLERIAATRGARVAYLSCSPETLTRDLALLARAGLKPLEIIPLDLMPQTDQVETLALIA